jgi:hypothetical protein
MVNSDELIGTTEYLTLCTRRRVSRCRCNRVRLYVKNVYCTCADTIFEHLSYYERTRAVFCGAC